MKKLQEQLKIVKQRLHYHFAKVGGEWNIEGMNIPFMEEFLNDVDRLCVLSDVNNQKEQLVKFSVWLSYRNLNDDSMNPEDWVDVYLANCD